MLYSDKTAKDLYLETFITKYVVSSPVIFFIMFFVKRMFSLYAFSSDTSNNFPFFI